MHSCAPNPEKVDSVSNAATWRSVFACSALFGASLSNSPPFRAETKKPIATKTMETTEQQLTYSIKTSGCSFLTYDTPSPAMPPDNKRTSSFETPPKNVCATAATTPNLVTFDWSFPVPSPSPPGRSTIDAPTTHTGNATYTAQCGFSRSHTAAPRVVTSGATSAGTAASARGRFAAVRKNENTAHVPTTPRSSNAVRLVPNGDSTVPVSQDTTSATHTKSKPQLALPSTMKCTGIAYRR
mmetsp:Transcript_990/g.3227  ORF Transcript_990/g.3227 Transcript_990/m.3227 type:complete len:240 (-) Transcript_990:367-1086(-)